MLADEGELAALEARWCEALSRLREHERRLAAMDARLEQLERHVGVSLPAQVRRAVFRGSEMVGELRGPTVGEMAMALGAKEWGPDQRAEARGVREACALAYDVVVRSTPLASPEKSLALVRLEEACMWAVKAISRGGA